MASYTVTSRTLVFGKFEYQPGQTFESDADLTWWLDRRFVELVSAPADNTDDDDEPVDEVAMPESLLGQEE